MADPIGEVTRTVTGALPDIKSFGAGFINFGAWLLLAIIFIIIVGVLVFFGLRRWRFSYKIVIFEKIGNFFEHTKTDRAMIVKLSTAGDTILYLMRHKKYLPMPSLQTGRKVYWYFIRQDDEWINFQLKDFDEEAKIAGAKFLDKEMRYARSQIQRGLKERYDKPGFWQQYGLLVFSMGFIALIGIFTWLLFDKWIDLAGVTNDGVKTAAVVLDRIEDILVAMDNVCSGGSGYQKVGG